MRILFGGEKFKSFKQSNKDFGSIKDSHGMDT